MDQKRFARLFPLGSHLCREPMPSMGELKRDMELLRAQGFNFVKLQEHWMIDEPVEGEYDFSRCEELIFHAAGLDMGVYLGLTCEQAPHWLYEKHPDCRMVGMDGRPIIYEAPTTLPADGKPGPCFDHPGAMADQLRFIGKLVRTLGAGENIVVWNTWQEVGYWSRGLTGQDVCFCANTMAAFHRWLEGRYGDLDSLNRAWKSRYPSWSAILPCRLESRYPLAVEIHWQYFMDNVQIAAVLQARSEAVKAADPLGRPVFAHKGGPDIGAGRDWNYARAQDFLGSSCYPAWSCGHKWDDGYRRPFERDHALLTEVWDGIVLRYDYIRCANPPGNPLWAAEFQGGPVSTGLHKGRTPSPDDMRRWMLSAASAGVTALSFWVTRAEIMTAEDNGFSLLDSVGESSQRLEEAGRIGRALQDQADLFAVPTLQPARVGLLVDEWNYQLCGHLAQGGENQSYSLRGWHRLLWEMNVPLDFVCLEHDRERAAQYDLLVMPFPLTLSEETAAWLVEYVRAGGNLVSEAGPGRFTETGFCNRGELSPAMADLFGVRQKSFTMVREPEGGERWSPPEHTWGEYLEPQMLQGAGPLAGQKLRANIYLETYEAAGGEPVLFAGPSVAGVRRRDGAGSAWLLGTFMGHNGTAYRDPASRKAARALLAACGVRPEHEGRLILRKRITPEKEAWILTNPLGEPITERLDTAGFHSAEDLFEGALPLAGGSLEITVGPLGVRLLILNR